MTSKIRKCNRDYWIVWSNTGCTYSDAINGIQVLYDSILLFCNTLNKERSYQTITRVKPGI